MNAYDAATWDANRGDYAVEVDADPAFQHAGVAHTSLVAHAVRIILARERVTPNTAVNVLLTGDDKLRELNRRFADDDHATDVLAFPADVGVPIHSEDATYLGDIAISIPQVVAQAAEHGVTTERELAMLAIHGTLHLLGYDHATPDEETVMFGKTDAALEEVFGEE